MPAQSLWELDTFYQPQDLIIAGSGFSGLWSAFYARQLRPDWKITIIEKNTSPAGASTRNAGFACFGSLTELVADAKSMGEDAMLETFSMRFEGIRRILSIFAPPSISYEQYGGYELIMPQQSLGPSDLREEILRINGLLAPITRQKNTFQQSDHKLTRFGFGQVTGLLENDLEGQLHPGKLIAVLSARLQQLGVRIISGTELLSYEDPGNAILVQTNHPLPFLTNNLLICTNEVTAGILPADAVLPARGQVVVTSPIPNLAFTGSFHFDEGYYYFRNLGNRVLLGGARNKAFEAEQTVDMSVSPVIQEELERFLREVILPGKQFTVDHRWSGIMGMPAGSKPIVKKLGRACYCALGLGGIGVAIAPVIGEKTAAMISVDAMK